jgi:hypothetical protein
VPNTLRAAGRSSSNGVVLPDVLYKILSVLPSSFMASEVHKNGIVDSRVTSMRELFSSNLCVLC